MEFYIKNKSEFNESILNTNIGDSLYIESIECLGNSIYEITEVLKEISNKQLILSISNSITFNFKSEQQTLQNVLDLLESICNLQKDRLSKSIKKALDEGKSIGRKKLQISDIPPIFFENLDRFNSKELNKTEFSKVCGCTRPTLNKWLKCISDN